MQSSAQPAAVQILHGKNVTGIQPRRLCSSVVTDNYNEFVVNTLHSLARVDLTWLVLLKNRYVVCL